MNKKFLILTLFAVAMLTTPIVGTAMAGKGQNKVDFQIHLVGLAAPPAASMKVAGGNVIINDLPFVMMGDMSWVKIDGETITAEFLDYEGTMDVQQHLDEFGEVKFAQVFVNEIYYIYDEEEDLRGTIVVKALGNNKAGNGGTFVGKGTGEFEGLIVKGAQDLMYPLPNPDYVDPDTTPDEPETFSVLDRSGTAKQ